FRAYPVISISLLYSLALVRSIHLRRNDITVRDPPCRCVQQEVSCNLFSSGHGSAVADTGTRQLKIPRRDRDNPRVRVGVSATRPRIHKKRVASSSSVSPHTYKPNGDGLLSVFLLPFGQTSLLL